MSQNMFGVLVATVWYLLSIFGEATKVDDWELDKSITAKQGPRVRPQPMPRNFPKSHGNNQGFFETITLDYYGWILTTLAILFLIFCIGILLVKNNIRLKIPKLSFFHEKEEASSKRRQLNEQLNDNKKYYSNATIKTVSKYGILFVFISFIFIIIYHGFVSTTNTHVEKYASMNVPFSFQHSLQSGSVQFEAAPMAMKSMARMNDLDSSRTIGLSVGGAKDINNFRENIKNGYLPQKTDVTMEGIFYDYYFDTGSQTTNPCKHLFCPSYTQGISPNPFVLDNVNNDEYFLSIGLNSNVKEKDFERNKLNLVVVLDISGSMDSSFDRYHYDKLKQSNNGNNEQTDSENEIKFDNRAKIEIAKDAVSGLLDHLTDDDRLGIVVFESQAYLAKPLNYLKNNDIDTLKSHIKEIRSMGGTNFESGYRMATQLFEDLKNNSENNNDDNDNEYDNRIIFLTDAMPNTGDINKNNLLGLAKTNAENEENRIYSTFVGVGVDFNTKLIDFITKIRGSNYYSVHSSDEFLTRMDNEFEYMVTPLVFNLKMVLDSDNLKIDSVYGSNSNDKNNNTNQIMHVTSLFPSAKSDTNDETKGGIILAKLTNNNNNNNNKIDNNDKLSDGYHYAKLSVSYEDKNGNNGYNEEIIEFNTKKENSDTKNEENGSIFDNNGIRKGVLLTRYVDLLHEWIDYETNNSNDNENNKDNIDVKKDDWQFNGNGQSKPMIARPNRLSQWERTSKKLNVSEKYREKFIKFKQYFENEMKIINDDTLSQEIDILDMLIMFDGTQASQPNINVD